MSVREKDRVSLSESRREQQCSLVRGIEKRKEVFIENFLLVPMLRVGTGLTLRDTSTLRDSTGLIGDV